MNQEQHPILQALQNYFDNTSKEQLEKDWEELKKFNQSGPDMLEILDNARERFMVNAKMYSSENPDDNAFCLPKDYEYNPDDYCQINDWIDNTVQHPTNNEWKIIHYLLDQGTYYAIAKWENDEWVGQTPALEKFYDDEVIEWCSFKNK